MLLLACLSVGLCVLYRAQVVELHAKQLLSVGIAMPLCSNIPDQAAAAPSAGVPTAATLTACSVRSHLMRHDIAYRCHRQYPPAAPLPFHWGQGLCTRHVPECRSTLW